MFGPSFKSSILVFYYLTLLVLNCYNCRCFFFVILLAAWYSYLVLPFSADFSPSHPIFSSQILLSSLALRLTSLSFSVYSSRSFPFILSDFVRCILYGISAAVLLLSRCPFSTTACFSFYSAQYFFHSYRVHFLHLYTVIVDIFPPLVLQICCAVQR